MTPYRGNQGNDRAAFVLHVYRIRRALETSSRLASFMPALHTGSTPADPHWGTVRVRVQMALPKDSKSPALL